MTKITEKNRNNITNDYINRILDGMDISDLEMFVADAMAETLDKYTDEELETEINDYYPDLLDGEQ